MKRMERTLILERLNAATEEHFKEISRRVETIKCYEFNLVQLNEELKQLKAQHELSLAATSAILAIEVD